MKETVYSQILTSTITHLTNVFDNINHALEVSRLTHLIFNAVEKKYQLVKEDKFFLEIAALLHDIGVIFGEKKHHKNSLEYILNLNLPCTKTEKIIIANIARYHRKAEPNLKHLYFRHLLPHQRYTVIQMSAILRIADALDRSHTQNIKDLDIIIEPNKITFNIIPKTDENQNNMFICNSFQLEKFAFEKKKKLFEKVFKIKAIFGKFKI